MVSVPSSEASHFCRDERHLVNKLWVVAQDKSPQRRGQNRGQKNEKDPAEEKSLEALEPVPSEPGLQPTAFSRILMSFKPPYFTRWKTDSRSLRRFVREKRGQRAIPYS